MKTHLKKHPYLWIVCILAITTVCVVSIAARRQNQRPTPELPRIVSSVRSLEVVRANLEGQDTLAIEIRNNSDKPIIAVSVESGSDRDASGVSRAGFRDGGGPPVVILEPQGTLTVHMPLSYVRPNAPVRVSSVIYADGSGEGDEASLGTLRRQREHAHRQPRRPEGGSSPQ